VVESIVLVKEKCLDTARRRRWEALSLLLLRRVVEEYKCAGLRKLRRNGGWMEPASILSMAGFRVRSLFYGKHSNYALLLKVCLN
jgi:hypothetical protein